MFARTKLYTALFPLLPRQKGAVVARLSHSKIQHIAERNSPLAVIGLLAVAFLVGRRAAG